MASKVENSDTLPLHGIRVVEFCQTIMGPSCGMFLGMLGAEVIKVEPPEGDKTRHLTGMGSPYFPLFNRGKKSVQLDLKAEAGRRALDALLATADVFVDNFRDASLAKMGADPKDLYSALHAIAPGDFSWLYVERGPGVWRVAVRKLSRIYSAGECCGVCGGDHPITMNPIRSNP